MKPSDQPPSQAKKSQGGSNKLVSNQDRPVPSPSDETGHQEGRLTHIELDFAARIGLKHDPPPTNPKTRRYFRVPEDTPLDVVETLPWPRELVFYLTSSFQKKVRALNTAFTNYRTEIEAANPSATPDRLDQMARERVRAMESSETIQQKAAMRSRPTEEAEAPTERK